MWTFNGGVGVLELRCHFIRHGEHYALVSRVDKVYPTRDGGTFAEFVVGDRGGKIAVGFLERHGFITVGAYLLLKDFNVHESFDAPVTQGHGFQLEIIEARVVAVDALHILDEFVGIIKVGCFFVEFHVNFGHQISLRLVTCAVQLFVHVNRSVVDLSLDLGREMRHLVTAAFDAAVTLENFEPNVRAASGFQGLYAFMVGLIGLMVSHAGIIKSFGGAARSDQDAGQQCYQKMGTFHSRMICHKIKYITNIVPKFYYFCRMEKIKQLQREFTDFIETVEFVKEPKGLYEPIAYTVLQKGKRLRPMLCLLANDMFGGNFDDAKYPALGLETGHNFSLIHDDIMDQAPLRRGMETVYKKWNTNTAILSGDVTLMMANQFVMRTSKPVEAATLFNKVMIEIGEGQQYDMNFETQSVVTIPEYLEMIRLKTAVLLATSLQMGAVIAGADTEDQKNLYDFGIALGMAFQLQDDVLDCYSDVAVFGKVTGGDIVENKKTMMYLKALELAPVAERERLEALFSGEIVINPQRKIDEVISMYDKLHVREAVEQLMAVYFRQAMACLDAVKLPEERKIHLRRYADLLSGREK